MTIVSQEGFRFLPAMWKVVIRRPWYALLPGAFFLLAAFGGEEHLLRDVVAIVAIGGLSIFLVVGRYEADRFPLPCAVFGRKPDAVFFQVRSKHNYSAGLHRTLELALRTEFGDHPEGKANPSGSTFFGHGEATVMLHEEIHRGLFHSAFDLVCAHELQPAVESVLATL